MFQFERLDKIKELLEEYRTVDVSELSEQLSVSEVTVRRDLEKLEKEGFLRRVYGGAAICEADAEIQPNPEIRSLPVVPAVCGNSRILGETAASLVEDYDVVFINASEPGVALAQSLRSRTGIVVITNYLPIFFSLYNSPVKVVLTGGEVDYGSLTLHSHNIGHAPCILPIHKAFIHFRGFSIEKGYSVQDYEELALYNSIRASSRHIIAMLEGRLFDKQGFFFIDNPQDISTVVTDKTVPDIFKEYYYRNDIALIEGFRFT